MTTLKSSLQEDGMQLKNAEARWKQLPCSPISLNTYRDGPHASYQCSSNMRRILNGTTKEWPSEQRMWNQIPTWENAWQLHATEDLSQWTNCSILNLLRFFYFFSSSCLQYVDRTRFYHKTPRTNKPWCCLSWHFSWQRWSRSPSRRRRNRRTRWIVQESQWWTNTIRCTSASCRPEKHRYSKG